MKLQELKTEVFYMAGVESLKEFKQKYEEYDDYYFNRKDTWEELYEIFQKREAEQLDKEQPVTQDEVLLAGGEIETEVDPQQVKDFLVATGADTDFETQQYAQDKLPPEVINLEDAVQEFGDIEVVGDGDGISLTFEEDEQGDYHITEIEPLPVVRQESYTRKGQIDLPKREEELTPHLVLNFEPAAQRISKQGKSREGMLVSRRIKKDKSKGFGS